MAAQNEIEILVTAEVKKAIDNINKVENQTKKSSGNMLQSLSKLKLGYLAIAAAIVGAIKFIDKFVTLAGEQEKAQSALSAAMKQAGTFTKAAYKENLEYARSLQKMTTFGDEAILVVQKLLTNFGIQGDELKGLTKATLDLATATGMDLNAAGALVAKTVGSSTNALGRYGVTVEGVAGSTERAQNAIKNITKLFGGSAEAAATTYAGRLQQAKNSAGDLGESIGFLLLPALTKLFTLITPIIDKISNFVSRIQEVNDKFSIGYRIITLYSNVFKILGNVMKVTLLQPIRLVLLGIEAMSSYLQEFAILFVNNMSSIKTAMVTIFSGGGIKNATKNLLDDLGNNFKTFGKGIGDAGVEFSKGFIDPYIKIGKASKTLYTGLKNGKEQAAKIDTETKDTIIKNENEILSKKQLTADQEKEINKITSEAIKQSEQELLQQKIDNINTFLETFALSNEQINALTLAREEYERQQIELTNQKRQESVLKALNASQQIFGDAANIAGSIVEIEKNKYNAIDETDTSARKAQAEKIKKAAKVERDLSISQATLQAILGAQRAYTAMAGIAPAPAFGIIAGASALGAGLANVAKIKSTPLPGFEHGGVSDGGLAMVGERGRELVNLPRGAEVLNHTETSSILNNKFNVGNITLPNVNNGQQFFEELQSIQRQYGVIG